MKNEEVVKVLDYLLNKYDKDYDYINSIYLLNSYTYYLTILVNNDISNINMFIIYNNKFKTLINKIKKRELLIIYIENNTIIVNVEDYDSYVFIKLINGKILSKFINRCIMYNKHKKYNLRVLYKNSLCKDTYNVFYNKTKYYIKYEIR
jgi:hypothetical protein